VLSYRRMTECSGNSPECSENRKTKRKIRREKNCLDNTPIVDASLLMEFKA